jgi:translation initiation factor eIF-2B subunit alpha/methylthioribose-1-phosphate isomerase
MKIRFHGAKILTHCNAGWLAFVDWGSALSPVYAAKRNDKNIFVFADETRPRLQGARLTAWELSNEDIHHAVIADNAAGYYMKKGEVDMVITGADRIAVNGDTANKIGTYEKAVLAKENNIPFYIAAPTSTIDINCESGDNIPIEERDELEVLEVRGIRLTPGSSHAKNPAFDVTPAKYIKGIITEKGIIEPNKESIMKIINQKPNCP